jgi:hypothetical protein
VPSVVTRIVAIPGDIIATQSGHILLNGKPADEPWLSPGATTPDYFAQPYGPLGSDMYVGMGDNRFNMVTYEFSRRQVEGSAGDVRAHSSHCDDGAPSPSSSSSAAQCSRRPEQGEAVTRACADMVIFMQAAAPQSAIEAVVVALRDDPVVEALTYLDQQTAQSEFSSIMSDQPNMVTPADLPTSFHVLLKQGEGRDAARGRYLTMPGVREVVLPPS